MPSPKPFGFYGLKLEPEIEQAIDALDLTNLQCLISDTAASFTIWQDSFVADELGFGSWFEDLSGVEKIALIRGLCDRIELRLMEAAQ